MLYPTLLCIRSTKVVDNSFVLQPKAILERRTLRLANVTTTTTTPERERKSTKPESREGKSTKPEKSG